EHGEIPRLEDVHHVPERRRKAAWKNAFPDPAAQGSRAIPADEVQEPTPGISDSSMDNLPKLVVVVRSDMLEHSHRDEHIEFAFDIAVVVFDELDPVAQSLPLGPFARKA